MGVRREQQVLQYYENGTRFLTHPSASHLLYYTIIILGPWKLYTDKHTYVIDKN